VDGVRSGISDCVEAGSGSDSNPVRLTERRQAPTSVARQAGGVAPDARPRTCPRLTDRAHDAGEQTNTLTLFETKPWRQRACRVRSAGDESDVELRQQLLQQRDPGAGHTPIADPIHEARAGDLARGEVQRHQRAMGDDFRLLPQHVTARDVVTRRIEIFPAQEIAAGERGVGPSAERRREKARYVIQVAGRSGFDPDCHVRAARRSGR
jgi:hypothetical protein